MLRRDAEYIGWTCLHYPYLWRTMDIMAFFLFFALSDRIVCAVVSGNLA